GRFRPRNDEGRARLATMGASEDRVYRTEEFAPGKSIVFSATGINDGDLLRGVKFFKNGARTHSISMGYRGGVIRLPDSVHLWGDGARAWRPWAPARTASTAPRSSRPARASSSALPASPTATCCAA